MGPAAKLGLILTMVALVCAVQLFEREMRAVRPEVPPGKQTDSGAAPLAALLAPLEDPGLPPLPDPVPEGIPDPQADLGAPAAGAAAATERTYIVKAGDTLARIARRTLGREGAWEAIYARNRALIRNPARLQVGMVLRIPAAEPHGERARELTRAPSVR